MQEEEIKYVCSFYIILELNVMNRVGRAIQIISMLVSKFENFYLHFVLTF